MNIGTQLVQENIELRRQWMRVHKWYYYKGEPIIDDKTYDMRYEWDEKYLGEAGCPDVEPEIPKYARLKEEAEYFDLPMWDYMKEYRRRSK